MSLDETEKLTKKEKIKLKLPINWNKHLNEKNKLGEGCN
jgi:hypothetical protein